MPTHEMAFAREVGDALVFLDDGVVVEAGRPRDMLSNPQHERTRAVLSKVLWPASAVLQDQFPPKADLMP